MNCEKVKALLDEYFDGTLAGESADAVEEHLLGCAGCRELFEETEAVIALARETAEPMQTPGDEFFSEVFTKAMKARRAAAPGAEKRAPHILRRIRLFFLSPVPAMRAARAAAMVVLGFFAATLFLERGPMAPAPAPNPENRDIFAEAAPTPTPVPTKAQSSAAVASAPEEPPPAPTPSEVVPASTMTEAKIDKSHSGWTEALAEAKKQYENQLNKMTGLADAQDLANFLPAFKNAAAPGAVLSPDAKIASNPPSEQTRLLSVVSPERQSEVLESLQKLKVKIYLSGESRLIPEVHEMEKFIVDIASATEPADQTYINNLKVFQEAEECLVDKKYLCAIENYQAVSENAPGSLMSFLGEYQSANVCFEQIGDYQAALTKYQKCLENYPSHYISEEKKEIILRRVDLLTRNASDDWRPLRLFLEAEKASVDAALANYREIISDYPGCSLVKDAAEAMTERVIAEDEIDPVKAQELIAYLQRQRENIEDKELAQLFQYKTAELFHQKIRDYPQALLEYTRAVEIDSNSELAQKAQKKIRALYQYGVRFR